MLDQPSFAEVEDIIEFNLDETPVDPGERGHSFISVGQTINDRVRPAVHIPRNACVQLAALQMVEYKPLSRGEVEARLKFDPEAPTMLGWEYWAREAGCADLL